MNEIVKMHNDLADLSLKGFNPSEIDILMAICYKCQDAGDTVTLNITDIKSLSDYKAKDEKRFYEDLKKTVHKLNSLNICVGESLREYEQFTLFPKFRVSERKGTVDVKVAEDFQYLLNEFTGNYTRLELQQSVGLSSKYSKQIYKMLRKFKSTGKWIINIDDFRNYLDIPKSFSVSKIDQRIINSSLEELQPLFKGLSVEKRYKQLGKGRPKVVGYEFTFQADATEGVKKEQKELSVDAIASMSGGWKKMRLCCPVCKEIIYEKRLENANGAYSMYGHPNYKTGKCSAVFFDRSQLIPYDRVVAEKESAERDKMFTDEERKANKAKLAKMFGNLFK